MNLMKTTIRIPKNELQALMPFVCEDYSRPVLQGIHAELNKDSKPILVATNGRAIAVLLSESEWDGEHKEIFLPADLLKQVLKWPLPKEEMKCITFRIFGSTVRVTRPGSDKALQAKLTCPGRETAVKYPAWRRVIPPASDEAFTVSDPCLCLNPVFLANFGEAVFRLSGSKHREHGIKIYPGKTELEPVVIRIERHPEFFGLVMPMRMDEPYNPGPMTCNANPPDWMGIPLPDGWQGMDSAPKDATWVLVKLANGGQVEAHWAENLSGEEQPPFSGWFIRGGETGFIGIAEPIQWKPLPTAAAKPD